jgi:RNA polymerase sigma-70 factor (ECF subfamily)
MRQFDSSATVDITVLYRRFIVMVRARACRLLGDSTAAQQVAQEAFSKLLEHRERQGTGQDTAAFLYRTVTNLALNHLREGLRQKELSRLKAPRGGQPAVAEDTALREILALVSYDEAQIAAYYYVDGMECEEIAQLLGIEKRTAEGRLAAFEERAQRHLHLTRTRVQHVA